MVGGIPRALLCLCCCSITRGAILSERWRTRRSTGSKQASGLEALDRGRAGAVLALRFVLVPRAGAPSASGLAPSHRASLDPDGSVTNRYNIIPLPTSFFIGRDGRGASRPGWRLSGSA